MDVLNRSNPLAPLAKHNHYFAQASGAINAADDALTYTGMVLLTFTSDATVTGEGWTFSWEAPAPPQCVGRTVAAASGSIDNGSGASKYSN